MLKKNKYTDETGIWALAKDESKQEEKEEKGCLATVLYFESG